MLLSCQILSDPIVVASNPLEDQVVGSSSNVTLVYASLNIETTSSGWRGAGMGATSVGAKISVTSKLSST